MRLKVEKTLRQFGISDIQTIGTKIITMSSKNFNATDIELVIIDIDSADFNAYEVIANLKKGSKSNQLPILALGNRSDEPLITQLKALGCTDYVTKPIDDLTFSSKVLHILREHQSSDSKPVNVETPQIESLKLEWQPAFETGVSAIDEEHKGIIMQYQKLYQMMKDGKGHSFYEELLIFLSNYISTHFAYEENFQKEIGYPQMHEHMEKHAFFKEKVQKFINEKPETVSNTDLLRLNLFVKDWLVQHIYIEDRKIGAYYKSQQ